MDLLFTSGALRALDSAAAAARAQGAAEVQPGHLLWALWQTESRAAEMLALQGVRLEHLAQFGPPADPPPASAPSRPPPHGDAVQSVFHEARRQVALLGRFVEIGSEHLLYGLSAVDTPVATFLHAFGLVPAAIEGRAAAESGLSAEPISAEVRLAVADVRSTDLVDAYRMIDAAANRAREGLRVLEDYVRFVLDDRHLTERLKTWRHEFSRQIARLDPAGLLAARDTQGDVGTAVRTRHEAVRGALLDVVRAAFKRSQEALRTLEECRKVVEAAEDDALGRLRYELYILEKAVLQTHDSRERLAGRDLYVLITEALCPHGSGPAIQAALAGGATIVQVREKTLPDRKLLEQARRVREWTRAAGALFIMNDRADLALLAEADGVHVGQDELSVHDARRILGPGKLVGVSTHTLAQARQAVLDGADYIGVGPVFATSTKTFDALAGLDFVREAAEITLPAYAIGGIQLDNVEAVIAAGCRRIAVSSALCSADDPEGVAREFVSRLRAARG